jgi:hypothetical protein
MMTDQGGQGIVAAVDHPGDIAVQVAINAIEAITAVIASAITVTQRTTTVAASEDIGVVVAVVVGGKVKAGDVVTVAESMH